MNREERETTWLLVIGAFVMLGVVGLFVMDTYSEDLTNAPDIAPAAGNSMMDQDYILPLNPVN